MLSISTLLLSDSLAHALLHVLQDDTLTSNARDRYRLNQFREPQALLNYLAQERRTVDCLLLETSPTVAPLLQQLREQAILLPLIILEPEESAKLASEVPSDAAILSETSFEEPSEGSTDPVSDPNLYHQAILHIPVTQLCRLETLVEEAIANFLKLSPVSYFCDLDPATNPTTLSTTHSSLIQQQRRLAEKLSERLGYLSIYYKRDSARFVRNMAPNERHELLQQLKTNYREIILNYFIDDPHLNEKIDSFVNLAFFADVPVAQIVEIHMQLIDDFSKQLKLEGRSDDILQDYRLTLIDTIAHLCEMYRRSIPRES